MLGSHNIETLIKKYDKWLPPAKKLAPVLKWMAPVEFAQAQGLKPDPWQAQVLSGKSNRMLLNCARQSGKSTIIAMLALWWSLYKPGSLILIVSPSLRQSGELFRKYLDGLNKLKRKPDMSEEQKLSCQLSNGSRVVSLPSSEATIRGFSGVSLLIEDEASRVSDSLYYSIRPMLATTNGTLCLLSTPFGKRGHFYQEWENGGEGWMRIAVPAAENPRISKRFLEDERRALGDYWYRQEYCCEFLDTTNGVFQSALVEAAISEAVLPLFGEQSADIVQPLWADGAWQ